MPFIYMMIFFIYCSLESVGRRPAGSQFYFHTYSKRLLILINHHLHCLILLVYLVFNRVLVLGSLSSAFLCENNYSVFTTVTIMLNPPHRNTLLVLLLLDESAVCIRFHSADFC